MRKLAVVVGVFGVVVGAAALSENNSSLGPLALDVPYVPVQETPIVLAQASSSATTQPDYIMTKCQDTASGTDYAGTAIRGVDPGGALLVALNDAAGKPIVTDYSAIKNITLLESTKHGKLVEQKDDEGLVSYYYTPTPDYVGDDRAVFMAEYAGKHYKIIVNLKVDRTFAGNSSACPDYPYQLKPATQPTNGGSIDSSANNFGTLFITFADLPVNNRGQNNRGQTTVSY